MQGLRLRRDPLEEGFTNTKSSAPAALFLRRHSSESKDCDCVAILRGGLHQHQIERACRTFLLRHPSESKDCDCVAILWRKASPTPNRARLPRFFYAAIRLKARIATASRS